MKDREQCAVEAEDLPSHLVHADSELRTAYGCISFTWIIINQNVEADVRMHFTKPG